MKINSNIQAMITNNVLLRNEKQLSNSTEKLSSGYRINSAKDNPAGMAITNKMNAQIRSLTKATQNSKNAVNAISTAEGALTEVENMIQRLNELGIKAANGTMTSDDRAAIQKEVDQLKKEITRVSKQTEYNTQGLLDGSQSLRGYSDNENVKVDYYNENFPVGKYDIELAISGDEVSVTSSTFPAEYKITPEDNYVTVTTPKGGELKISVDKNATSPVKANLDLKGTGGMTIQVGSAEGQEIQVVIPKMSLENMGIAELDMSTEEGANKALDQLKGALAFVSDARASLGAYENRFDVTVSSLNVSVENLTGAFSTIRDVDMAEEMVEYTKLQVLVQAGTSMLTQANEQPQQALQLLQ